MRLALGDDLHSKGGQLVHDATDRDLISRYYPGGEDHRVARSDLDLVVTGCDPAERGPGFALTASRDNQHFFPRQTHGLVEADRRREFAEVASCLRHPKNPLQRATGDADFATR